MNKEALRRALFDARRRLTPEQRQAANTAIQRQLLDFLAGCDATSVAAYMPTATEPGGADLVEVLRGYGLRVIVPVTHEDHSMTWVHVTDDVVFRPQAFGILEPAGPAVPGNPLTEVDVIIVPALAADRQGYRLGKGGGFYDRALADLDSAATVSVLFDHELLPSIPTQPHDARTAAIITPTEVLRIMEPFAPADPSN